MDLLRRGNADYFKKWAFLLDPEDEEYSFGINLLQCDNVASRKARNDTYTKAYNVFYKLWEDQWGPWLQLILQNVLWAFIENQGYTLADVPMFLNHRNVDFRNHIVDNIKYNPAVADFWRYEFFERREQSQQERADAALTRINTLLTHPDVRDIVGQQKTTINFKDLLTYNKYFGNVITLLKLSANLAEDIKKFVGTILLSELVFALRDRPEGERGQICVFVDEFHNFASSDYMATMVTEGRKFGVASTFLHVERFGQLAHNQKLMGATQAIVNKGMFQSTVNDANEFAPEYAKEPTTTEVRLEPELVVSQEPFWDMLRRGHANPKIQAYIYKYLRPQKEDLDFYKQKIESSQLGRMNLIDLASLYRDEAAIARIDEAMDRIVTAQSFRNVSGQLSALSSARNALENAQSLRQKAQNETDLLMYRYKRLRNTIEEIRKVDRFFTGIMYEHIQLLPEQEDLAQTLRTLLVYSLNNERHLEPRLSIGMYQLYLQCRFGDPFKPRTMPSLFALKFRPQLIEEAYMYRRLEEIQEGREEAEEHLKKIINDKSFEDQRIKPVILDGSAKKSLEHSLQHFRTYFRPSEIVVNDYHVTMKIPDRLPPGYTPSSAYKAYEEWLPDYCLPHVFTQEEIKSIIEMCEAVLTESVQAGKSSQHVFTGIDEMFDFFNLLAKPENHIKVPSGQYVEKHVNVRPVHDMTNEMAQELGRLPRFEAYVKLIDEVANKQVVRTHRIQTHPLPEIQSMETESQAIANGHTLGKKRIEIEAEIRERQKRWLPGSDKPTTRGR